MFRQKLIDFMNKYPFIQYIFLILPLIMVAIYGYAYMTDMLSIAGNLATNDHIAEQSWGTDELHEVSYTENKEGGGIKAVVDGQLECEEVVAVDDVIFYVQVYATDWYQLVTASGKSTFLEHCDLFDAELIGESFKITHDDYEDMFEPGDLVCGVTVADNGLWRVSFLKDDLPHYDLEELHMLELLSVDEGMYTVKVNSSYVFEAEDFEVNFCTSLPTNNLYFDESSQSFVRNVSQDYAKTFILRSNILIVILSTIIYCMLLWKIAEEKKLSLLDNRWLLIADTFATCLLPCAVPFTLIML